MRALLASSDTRGESLWGEIGERGREGGVGMECQSRGNKRWKRERKEGKEKNRGGATHSSMRCLAMSSVSFLPP